MKKSRDLFAGIVFVAIFAAAATMVANLEPIKALGISPLVVAIALGIFYANTLHHKIPKAWESGIAFSGKKILRFAIVFYGFQITFQEVISVGLDGFLVSLIMVTTTFLLGTIVGQKFFGLDRDTSMLTASGAAVCGAAAVIATEPVLKSSEHKAAVAVSMVVLFGTIAMFLYPALYSAGILAGMDERTFGIFVGGTVHEVAQVVAVGNAFGKEAADASVIVKMTRVLLIAPLLITLSLYLSNRSNQGKTALTIPWFAIYFLVMAGVHSLLAQYFSSSSTLNEAIDLINQIDIFLLTMAMAALGMGTRFAKFKGLGVAPIYTAGVIFVWLIVGGYFVTMIVVGD